MRKLGTVCVLTVVGACSSGSAPESGSSPLALEELLRVGRLDGPVEYTFGRVAGVTVALDGSVIVGDAQGPVVRRYSVEGVYLGDIGRAGEGPGEYSSLAGLGVAPSGDLAVFDVSNARVTWFTAAGDFRVSSSVYGGVGSRNSLVVGADGSVVVRIVPESGFVESIDDGLAADWARVSTDGSVTRLTADLPEGRVGPRYVIGGRGGVYHPFVKMTVTAASGDGSLYSVRNDRYRIVRRHSDGSESFIERSHSPISVSEEEAEEWARFSEMGAQREGAERGDYFPIPDEKPFIRNIMVDSDGRLWVSRYTEAVFMEYSDFERDDRLENGHPSYQWRDRPDWDVFGADGDYLGTATLPFKTTLLGSRGDLVWGVQAGDFNEDYVVLWRMR